jgi:hypothetical protein
MTLPTPLPRTRECSALHRGTARGCRIGTDTEYHSEQVSAQAQSGRKAGAA